MDAARLLEIVLEGEQERPVTGQLGQRSLHLVVEVVVAGDLRQEGARAARLAQGRHPEEDLPSVVVLGDCLERLEVLEPETEHLSVQQRPRGAGYGVGSDVPLEGLDQLGELVLVREVDL